MRWFGGLFGLLLMALVVSGVGYATYQAGLDQGFDDGVVETIAQTSEGGTVIVQERGGGFGFAPFGFLGILFGWFILMGLLKALFFRGHRRGGAGPWGYGRGGWRDHARQLHDEWHAEATRTDAGSSPSTGSA